MNQPNGQQLTVFRNDVARVRRAAAADVPELVRLRSLLFETRDEEYFNPASVEDDWRRNLASVLEEQLTADTARILVVDGAHGLAACGIGTVEQWFPGPHSVTGRVGHVIGVVTDPAYRRRGHSRAIMRTLLDWFDTRGASRVDLYASAQGEPLYRDLGFVDHPDPALYWRPAHR
ncbi:MULTISPECIES: GNAT family N-acetyltransferase [Streptomyces]|uniref:GNAT family N-acetyltransferase n=1 Tax=Streptomyces venezuelae TaxID=54571 RepID=A0A5P2BKG7_STRVZ|nr:MULTISPECIES: GNAT family N-acetyltransferase [Streptomyces]NEA02802.1 GNAT family N-acetyltransferase [Streptomyces sp. SID10116]MYY81594.1 GNAT family N-acetyltransferase [Streptomyces sp. SID335]MYZ15565.1 GNAT family N-acetyltransferase [Streptomyces sp. SID337]NDZ90840.1 GNAT family N-acetyltransferase [Streptomyces sp. SID10115]NEB46924.1 GNAT family N-acetyltransferase [Streptomyces sp. SID339]